MKAKAEFIEWEDIKRDAKLPKEDCNEGYVFGIAYLCDEGIDTLDCEWFKSNEERYKVGKGYDVVNYVG